MNVPRLAAIVVLPLMGIGCAARIAAPAGDPHRTSLASTDKSEAIPFSARIFDEVNDGERLYVAGEIEAQTAWDPAATVLHLSVLNRGDLVSESVFRMNTQPAMQNLSAPLAAGTYPFSISAPSRASTEYQLEVLWGSEAAPYLQEEAPSALLQLRGLEIERQDCGASECEAPFVIKGELVNTGTGIVASATLGVGYVRRDKVQSLDSAAALPQNEEKLEIAGLTLLPGKARSFRLAVGDNVAPDILENLVPVVRVLLVEPSAG